MQLKDYLNRKQVPLIIYLELTHRCSFLCVHCYIPEELRKPKPATTLNQRLPLGMSTAEIKTLLHDLAASQALFLVLTGGEIFLRPDLHEITATATQLGFSVKYYTNGFHITPEWADRIKQLGVYAVDLSVYGASEETYAAVTKVKGGYAKILQTLGYLRERNIRFTVKTPVMKENFRDIPKIKQLAEDYGGYFRYDLVLIPRFDGDEGPYQHRLADEEIAELLATMNAKFDAKGMANFEPHACSVGKWSAVISPDGEVYPCIELRQSLGNVRQTSFQQIWQDNPQMREIRHTLANMKVDQEVFGDGMCGHCPAHSLKTAGDLTKPSQEHQRIAAVKRRFLTA